MEAMGSQTHTAKTKQQSASAALCFCKVTVSITRLKKERKKKKTTTKKTPPISILESLVNCKGYNYIGANHTANRSTRK